MAFYGLRRPAVPARRLLFYLPLALLASANLWFGAARNLPPLETALYIASMLLVGLLEELIFRGLLFRAISRDSMKTAVVLSSVTFGMGHIVNLLNGSGASLFSNLLQVAYAVAVGLLFTVLFYRTKSLWACIVTHGVLNSLHAFAPEGAMTPGREIFTAAALTVLSLAYAGYLSAAVKEDS